LAAGAFTAAAAETPDIAVMPSAIAAPNTTIRIAFLPRNAVSIAGYPMGQNLTMQNRQLG
jgi:hypothetical protein